MKQVETGDEPSDSTTDTSDTAATPRSFSDRLRSRAVLLTLTGIFVFFGTTGFVLYFKPFSDKPPVGDASLDVFAAGPFDIYEPGSITHFEKEGFFLVRLQDGAFLALYDLGPLAQASVDSGDLKALECRAVVQEDDEMAGWLSSANPPPGFKSQGIYDACYGVAWDARGQHVWGTASGDLDRFPVETIDEIVRVNLGHRRCMNELGPGSPCIPTR